MNKPYGKNRHYKTREEWFDAHHKTMMRLIELKSEETIQAGIDYFFTLQQYGKGAIEADQAIMIISGLIGNLKVGDPIP